MANIKCPKCGEEYSGTYRKCPFCQEEEALRKGKTMHRTGKRLDKKKRSSGAGGVLLLLAVVVVCGVAGFMFFGDLLADVMGIRLGQDDQKPPVVENQDPQAGNTAGEKTEEPKTDEKQPEGETTAPEKENTGRTEPLSLSHTEMTIPAGSTGRITATAGFGTVKWASSNENIATVSDGSVTGKAGGTVTITATLGEETATCTVTVSGAPWVSNEVLKLNKTDFTLRAGDPDVPLKISGNYSSVVWASSNPNVATVSEDGVVKRVGPGRADITATADGHVLTCIVRVK